VQAVGVIAIVGQNLPINPLSLVEQSGSVLLKGNSNHAFNDCGRHLTIVGYRDARIVEFRRSREVNRWLGGRKVLRVWISSHVDDGCSRRLQATASIRPV
jgi:hypothetical protein